MRSCSTVRRRHVQWAMLGALAISVWAPSTAWANGFEYPELGTEVMGRAGAWTARADTPLAMALNPAGLAGQGTSILLDANAAWNSMCFARSGTYPSQNTYGSAGDLNSYKGAAYPQVCKQNGIGDVNVVPQLIFAYQINPRLTLAAGVVSPNAAGKATWPTEVPVTASDGSSVMAPAPQRYLLLSQNAIIVYPSIGVGWEVAPGVRIGGTFQAVISYLQFSNVAQASYLGGKGAIENPNEDLKADLTAKKWFTPAFVLGSLLSPAKNFDIGVMFRWSADIDTTNTTLHVTGPYPGSTTSGAGQIPAGTDYPNNLGLANSGNTAHFMIAQPWDLKIGFRYHQPRAGAVSATGSVRDPMSMDVFDAELDVTYSHNSSLDQIGILFPAGTKVNFGSLNSADSVPQDASVPHNWQDVWGFRVGGEYVVMPNQLAVRAGAYFQTSGVDPAYLSIDFAPTQQFGAYVGGTYRISNFDVSLGLGHVFYATLNNNGNGSVFGLLADNPTPANPSTSEAPGLCASAGLQSPTVPYRMCGPQNGGVLTQSLNVVSLGVTKHF